MSPSPDIKSILNFRDVGETVNQFLGKRLVREGLIYRSAKPDDASIEDRKALRDDLGMKAVMDLRTKTEHLKQAQKRQADLKIPALLQSNAALAEPVQIPGLKYHEIKLTGKAFERHLLSQLSWWSFIRLIFLFLCGYRVQAISILGQEVMLPRGLVGLGLDTLDHSGPEVAMSLRSFLEPSGIPMLIHCTQGKDRTGLVVALVLMILRVPTPAIEYDYALTDAGLVSNEEERMAEIREIGLTEEWGRTAPDMIVRVVKHLNEQPGGLDGYLDKIGFVETDRDKLRELLAY